MSNLISVVIPFSKASEERKRNLFYAISYYKKNLPNAFIIVAEQDSDTDFESISDKVDSHIKVDTNGDLFNRSLLLNKGFNSSQTNFCSDYIIFADGDCLIEESILKNIENYYQYFDKYFTIPYNDKIFYLSKEETEKVIYNNEGNTGDNITRNLEYVTAGSGGTIILSAKNYYRVGGFDERFKGWGVEDNAFHNKCLSLGLSIYRLEGELVHLNHSSSLRNMKNYENNVKIYNETMNSNNIKEYIDLLGYDHLVRPCIK
jgi:predicted glycosyltransferase involved in capsule biosynthesis